MGRYKYEVWTAFNDQYEGKATDAKKSAAYDSLKDVCFFLNLTPSRARNIISRSPGGELNRKTWSVVEGRLVQILKKWNPS